MDTILHETAEQYNLERLLELRRGKEPSAVQEQINSLEYKTITSPKLRAKKNATLDDFIAMVAEVVSKAMKKYDVEFVPDEGAVIDDPSKRLERPAILYKVVQRVPKLERKQRYTEDITEIIDSSSGQTRVGHNWSMRMNCIVQFDVVASNYITANKVMELFEDTIFTYTGYFKRNGVAEILLEKYYTDKNLDAYRQSLSVRSIQYFVEVEKLITVFDTEFVNINV